jgi:GNAT superfamily N-acetyltransferase
MAEHIKSHRINEVFHSEMCGRDRLEYRLIAFDAWLKNMRPLWNHVDDFESVPLFDNRHGIVQYSAIEAFEKIVVFPVEMLLNGQPIGWTSIYNISDVDVRIRGLYVLPEFRGRGLGFRLCDAAISLWPLPWSRCFGLWRSTAYPRLQKHWKMKMVEGYLPRAVLTPTSSGYKPNTEFEVIFGYRDFNTDSHSQSISSQQILED